MSTLVRAPDVAGVYYDIPLSADSLPAFLAGIEIYREEFTTLLKEICSSESHEDDDSNCPCCGHALEAAKALHLLHSVEPLADGDSAELRDKMIRLCEG